MRCLTYLLVILLPGMRPDMDRASYAPTVATAGPTAGCLRTGFVQNAGQWDERALFAWRRGDLVAHVERDGLRLARRRSAGERTEGFVVRLCFDGCAADAVVEGVRPGPSSSNFFLGNDAKLWRTGVRGFAGVAYRGLYPGIDLELREERGRLEYDFHVCPGAALDQVRIRFEGPADASCTAAATVFRTPFGDLLHDIPRAWYLDGGGRRIPVACRFMELGDGSYGIVIQDPRRDLALVIDPGLDWATYLGGSDYDFVQSVGVAANGDLMLVGSTSSVDFPATPGAFSTTRGANGQDAFVTRLSADGSHVVWSTFIGGSQHEEAFKAVFGPAGETTLIGTTESPDFPTTPGAFSRSPLPNPFPGRGFVTRLDPSGSALLYSTFLGNYGPWLRDIALHTDGSVVVTGASSGFWPTTPGAYMTSGVSAGKAFVTRLNAQGTALVASTLIGTPGINTSHEAGTAVAIAANGEVTVAGQTYPNTALFPTTAGAFCRTFGGGSSDAFVARLDPTFSRLIWSTLLGGNGAEGGDWIALSATGSVVVAGNTNSTTFPTTAGVVAPSLAGGGAINDGFVTRLDSTGSTLEFSTYLNGALPDWLEWMGLDGADDVVVVGFTSQSGFPTTPGARDRSYHGRGRLGYGDAIVVKLDARGTRYVYSSFLGGVLDEEPRGAALLPSGALAVVGWTESGDFPVTAGAFQTTYHGSGPWEGFVAVEQMLPDGVSRYGVSTPWCGGPLTIDVSGQPLAGDPTFTVTCRGTPAASPGALLLGTTPYTPGIPFFGATFYLIPTVGLSTSSTPLGTAVVGLPIPSGIQGARVFAQFVWPMPASCTLPNMLTSSNALDITVR